MDSMTRRQGVPFAVMEPHNHVAPPVACTLGPDDASAQLQEWADLRRHFRIAEPTAQGVHLWFDAAAGVPLRAVAAKEAACCAFLQFAIVDESGSMRLDVTSDQPAARPVIALLAALVSGQDQPAS
jgi:hypothetical protein